MENPYMLVLGIEIELAINGVSGESIYELESIQDSCWYLGPNDRGIGKVGVFERHVGGAVERIWLMYSLYHELQSRGWQTMPNLTECWFP